MRNWVKEPIIYKMVWRAITQMVPLMGAHVSLDICALFDEDEDNLATISGVTGIPP
jgi:hypothetical protein